MANIRSRLFMGASREIISINTHMEQGLSPSSKPMAIVNSGKPTSSSDSLRPKKSRKKESGSLPETSAPASQDKDCSASQLPEIS